MKYEAYHLKTNALKPGKLYKMSFLTGQIAIATDHYGERDSTWVMQDVPLLHIKIETEKSGLPHVIFLYKDKVVSWSTRSLWECGVLFEEYSHE